VTIGTTSGFFFHGYDSGSEIVMVIYIGVKYWAIFDQRKGYMLQGWLTFHEYKWVNLI
jgi:hypothetical protein